MLQKILATGVAASLCAVSFAQDTTKKGTFTLSGNLDAYYRYNFSNPPHPSEAPTPPTAPGYLNYNSPTSFTATHNSFELGMASIKAEYTKGKAGVVIDLGFGRRAEEFAYNDANTRLAIKQAYVTFAPSDAIKFSFGSWATHVGYEVLDPYLNRNYSMSYMFSYGPFSHTGIKADIALGGASSLMVGIANPTDYRSAPKAPKTVLAQFATGSSDEKLKAYLNFAGGKQDDLTRVYQGDVVLTYAFSDKFSMGYNGTYQSVGTRATTNTSWESSKWWGSALYFNVDPTDYFGLTLRTEYLGDKDHVKFGNVFSPTLSANFKVDNLTIIPEFRFDSAKDELFVKKSGDVTKSTGSFILAATYHF
ncbi:outer membrane beta-barrel protein [Filimonas effusa]|uniref:Porin n=1 Tax=Filimonas effusa TaxID=2508721 RepID=A0A4Q1DDX9_9BACT|nr:outer membrane beta-barrel protein [Filimonas effusa]RXK87178.1 porin [Filimonas effusa]